MVCVYTSAFNQSAPYTVVHKRGAILFYDNFGKYGLIFTARCTSFDAPPRETFANIRINLIPPATTVIGLHFCR